MKCKWITIALTATPVLCILALSSCVPSPSSAPSLASDETKTRTPKMEDRLIQILVAFRAGDKEKLATMASGRDVDLAGNQVRVVLEMDISPEAHPVGTPSIETVTLPDGRTVQIKHAPAIAVRPDLADAIAAAGATYETAYENLVQVWTPIASLEALTRIPGVRYVRMPYAAQP